ncbi:HEAT repeat domain-containing protein [Prochlorococcus sp. MIT 1341]|uniref:HEAT repeat domain-containing protein n=1 Tax=Prochlorococcus sp. MIT 1341 TaxID=3096221 RepID=UPI002A7642E1|nr:HEAT repeat domain-containing protein [Prochlorococcus sp. MIT 1341]
MCKKEDYEKPSLESLFKDFDHPNPNINKNAYVNMQRYWPEESMDILLKRLDDDDLLIRRKVVKALGFYGKEVLHPLVVIYRQAKNKNVLVSCMKTFVRVAINAKNLPFPKEAIKVIELSLNEEIPELILTVIPLLKLLGEQGLPILLDCARDENLLKSSAAIMALGEMEAQLVEEPLQALFLEKNLDPIVRSCLNVSLENLK